jgi:glutathione S-transferase
VPEYAAAQKQNAEERLVWLNDVLASRPFVAGERYTIADITAVVAIDFGRTSKIAIQPDQTHLKRWHEAVSARPSAKA